VQIEHWLAKCQRACCRGKLVPNLAWPEVQPVAFKSGTALKDILVKPAEMSKLVTQSYVRPSALYVQEPPVRKCPVTWEYQDILLH